MQKLSALVADDASMVRQLVAEVLNIRGYEVRVACDGEEALDLFREQPDDLVILDVDMPRMDGMEALRHLRALDLHVGIVLMTGHDGGAERVAGGQLGAVLVNKPFSIAKLNALFTLIEEDRARWLATKDTATETPVQHGVATAADRRRHLRAPVSMPASVRADEGDPSLRECQIVDISLGGGGMQFHLDHPFAVETQVTISIVRPDPAPVFVVAGRILWTDAKARLCGVEFCKLDSEQRVALENIVVAALRSSR